MKGAILIATVVALSLSALAVVKSPSAEARCRSSGSDAARALRRDNIRLLAHLAGEEGYETEVLARTAHLGLVRLWASWVDCGARARR